MIPAPTNDSIMALQLAMVGLPQAQLHTEHFWADGMYCRALYRPKDTLIVGKVHKREHFYIVVSGEVTVLSDGIRERVKAPKIFVGKPGTKRAVYAHEDSLCITVHRTNETDLDKIEAELIEPDETALFDARNVERALK
jgi:mannose-6-phosphate isomerase-like protein (cupin superfamily)